MALRVEREQLLGALMYGLCAPASLGLGATPTGAQGWQRLGAHDRQRRDVPGMVSLQHRQERRQLNRITDLRYSAEAAGASNASTRGQLATSQSPTTADCISAIVAPPLKAA